MSRDILRSPSTAVVFAHALTGLGHLRVSFALYNGLPSGVHAYLLNSQDERLNAIHRVMSVNPQLRDIMEATQSGTLESVFTVFMRWYFRSHTSLLWEQLQTILDEHVVKPKTMIVVATHTFLGHQIAAIKKEFSKKNGITLVLIVVVTDDSPQKIWAVGGADLIFVPSQKTKDSLVSYHRRQHSMAPSTYIVDPYMISPKFGEPLTHEFYVRRKQGLRPDMLAPIHVSVPVSGAAVQLAYIESLIRLLSESSDRYRFHVVALQNPSTFMFLNSMIGKNPCHYMFQRLIERSLRCMNGYITDM